MTNNQLTEQQIDLLIENGYDIAYTLENLAENEINSDCFEVFSYSENGRETEWDGKITEFAQRAAKAIRHLTDATTALQAELQERRKADSEPVGYFGRFDPDDEGLIDQCSKNVKGSFPLYLHAQQPVVPPMQHWEELCREHPDMSIGDAIIRAAWWNHCRAAMLQARSDDDGEPTDDERIMVIEGIIPPISSGKSPVIPEGLIAAVNRLLDSDGSRGSFSAIRCYDAHQEIEKLLSVSLSSKVG